LAKASDDDDDDDDDDDVHHKPYLEGTISHTLSITEPVI